MVRRYLYALLLAMMLIPRPGLAVEPAVVVETSLSQLSDGVAVHLAIHNRGQVPVGVVGGTPCDPGIRAVVFLPDGRQETLEGRTQIPLGNCALQVLQEHEIGPGARFLVDYHFRPGPDPVVGKYVISFRAPLAAYAKRHPLQITAETSFTIPFGDAAWHWAMKEIAQAVAQGWVNGYPDGTFRPDQKVSAEEFVKMLAVSRGLRPIHLPGGGEWFRPWMAVASNAGWLVGPVTGEIRFADALTILVRSTGLPRANTVQDGRQAWEFYHRLGSIVSAEPYERMSDTPVTRAHAVVLILRMNSMIREGTTGG